jgi:hypothetical protein
MPTLRFAVDPETYEALVDHANRHLRPTDNHAAALLRMALGLPVPIPARGKQESAHMVPIGEAETNA